VLRLTFYVDDIAISGERARECVEEVVLAIQRHGYAVPCKKKRLMHRAKQPQRITGVVVNRKTSVGQARIRELRLRIQDLSQAPEVPVDDLRSVRSAIAQVAYVCPAQGAALARLAGRRTRSKSAPSQCTSSR
jgi:hypothetical protein